MSFILFTRKVTELGLEAPWTMLSRIGLVSRVIREGLVPKAAISCLAGKPKAFFYSDVS